MRSWTITDIACHIVGLSGAESATSRRATMRLMRGNEPECTSDEDDGSHSWVWSATASSACLTIRESGVVSMTCESYDGGKLVVFA